MHARAHAHAQLCCKKATLIYSDIQYYIFTISPLNTQDKGEYLLKWRGCPSSQNTWEPPSCLKGCQRMLAAFKAAQKNARTKKQKMKAKPTKRKSNAAKKTKKKK